MELIIAFVVLAAGAWLALRSATATEPVEPGAEPEPAIDVTESSGVALETGALPTAALLEDGPDGDAPVATAEPDPDATLTAAAPAISAPPLPGGVLIREPIAITEDRRLEDVLEAAEEAAPEPSYPTLRLLAAILGLSLAFAAALLLVVRGIQAVWSGFFG